MNGILDEGETDPVLADTDSDGLRDDVEVAGPTDPQEPDSENDGVGDGLLDGIEDANGNGIVDAGETDPLVVDTDGDGLSDGVEVNTHGTDPLDVNTDDDFLNDDVEINTVFTNPLLDDTDGDGLLDGIEDANGNGIVDAGETDPLLADTDADGLRDDVEVAGPTDPLVADTDVDGLFDGIEDANANGVVDAGETNPLVADTDGDGLDDGIEDANANGVVDAGETNPLVADTDGDTISDGEEVVLGVDNFITNPTLADTDGDGLTDDFEIGNGTDPTDDTDPAPGDDDGDGIPDSVEDQIAIQFGAEFGDSGNAAIPLATSSDGDTIIDSEEVVAGVDGFVTDPTLADTDGDGLNDDIEVAVPVTDPTKADTDGDGLSDGTEDANANGVVDAGETNPLDADTDGDTLSDGAEVNTLGTDPLLTDTDGDTLSDDTEVTLGTNPLVADTDGDGLSDSFEVSNGTDPNDSSDPNPLDIDGDGILNDRETELATLCACGTVGDPNDSSLPSDTNDFDGDTISDLEEETIGADGFVTNPLQVDTDQDGIADNNEFLYEFESIVTPTDPTNDDTDGDELNDGAEEQGLNGGFITNATNPDTDGDGVDDGIEITDGTNPTDPSDFIDRTNAGTATFGFVDVFDISAPDDNPDLCNTAVGCTISLFFTQADADDLGIAPLDMKLLQDIDKNGAFNLTDGSPEVLDGNPPVTPDGLSGAACEAAVPNISVTPCTFVEQISTDPPIFTATATVFFNSKFAIGGVKALALGGAIGIATALGAGGGGSAFGGGGGNPNIPYIAAVRLANLGSGIVGTDGTLGFGAVLTSADLYDSTSPQIIQPGEKVSFRIDLYENQGINNIGFASLSFTPSTASSIITQDPTTITFNKYQPLEIIDPSGLLSDTDFTILETNLPWDNILKFDTVFTQTMPVSDIKLEVRDLDQNFDKATFDKAIAVSSNPLNIMESSVPDWVKNNADWWSQGHISDAEFMTGIEYLIAHGTITIPATQISADSTEEIPNWMRSNAEWWANGLITETDFIQGIQWLVSNGIIIINL